MKTLVFSLIFTASITAQAQVFDSMDKTKELIKANAFKCSGDEIVLKGLWGDTFGSWNIGGEGTFKRSEMKEILCGDVLQSLYRDGAPEVFDLLLKVKKFEIPEMWGSILGLKTRLNESEKARVRGYLNAYGVSTDSPTDKLAQHLIDHSTNRITKNVDPQFYKKLDELTSGDNVHKIKLMQMMLPNHFIIEDLLSMERDEPESNVTPIINRLLEDHFRVGAVGVNSFANKSRRVPVSTQLFLSGRGHLVLDQLDSYYHEYVEQNIKAAAFSKEDNVAGAYLNQVANRYSEQDLAQLEKRPSFDGELCALLVGKMATTKNEFLRNQLLKIYTKLNKSCLNGKVVHRAESNGYQVLITKSSTIDLLEEYPKSNSELTEKLLALQRGMAYPVAQKIRALMNDKCSYNKSFKPLLSSISELSADLLIDAIEAKCGELVKDVAANMSAQQVVNFFDYRVVGKKIDKRYIVDIVKVLNEDGRSTPGYLNKTIEERFGKDVFRAVNVSRRASDPKDQQKLLEADEKDSEETVNLKWKDMVIELNRSKMTEVQQALVDKLRISKSNEDTASALRNALIDWQLSVKFVKTAADELRASIEQFKPASDLLASLSGAKVVLDQTLTKGGRKAIYNERFTSVFDPIVSGRSQCNGGTDFMLLHSSKAGLEDANEIQVVIYQPKHILPGVVRKNLTTKIETIESTVNKEARGSIDAVAGKWPFDRRVVLAEDYLVEKLLGPAMKNRAKTAEEFFARAEKVMNVKQGDITPKKAKEEGRTSGYADALNTSPFGFGDADIPSGDVVRQDMTVVPQNLSGTEATRLAVPRIGHGSALSRFAPTKKQEGFASMRMPIPDYERVVVPPPQEDPVGHIVSSIEREYRYGLRSGAMNIGQPEEISARLHVLLYKLTQQQLGMLADALVRSKGAVVDIIALGKSNLRRGFESPQQKRIEDSRDLFDLHIFLLKAVEDFKYSYGSSRVSPRFYDKKNGYTFESRLYPPCSVEDNVPTMMKSTDPKACDYNDDWSKTEPEKGIFQQNRRTKLHQNIVKFRVLMQDSESDTPKKLDIVIDVNDDGDFTIYFHPILDRTEFRGEWRRELRKWKDLQPRTTPGQEPRDFDSPAMPTTPEKEKRDSDKVYNFS